MPQMAPISWLTLYLIFSLTFIMFNLLNYYSFNSIMPKSTYLKMTYKHLNWKW